MADQFITLQKAMDTMRQVDRNGTPIPFNVTVCQYDQSRNKGGKIKEIKGAIKVKPPGDQEQRDMITLRTQDQHDQSVHLFLILQINGITIG